MKQKQRREDTLVFCRLCVQCDFGCDVVDIAVCVEVCAGVVYHQPHAVCLVVLESDGCGRILILESDGCGHIRSLFVL